MSTDPKTTLLNMARQLLTSTDDQPIERAAISEAIDAVRPMVERRTGHVFAAMEIADIMRLCGAAGRGDRARRPHAAIRMVCR